MTNEPRSIEEEVCECLHEPMREDDLKAVAAYVRAKLTELAESIHVPEYNHFSSNPEVYATMAREWNAHVDSTLTRLTGKKHG